MHFFRSLYHHTLEQEGFFIYKINLQDINPKIKHKLDLMSDSIFTGSNSKFMVLNLYNYIQTNLVTGKKTLQINEPFEIVYLLQKEEGNYIANIDYYNGIKRHYRSQTTIAKIKNKKLVFYENGSFSKPDDLTTIGYWSYIRMGDSLPFDYQVHK